MKVILAGFPKTGTKSMNAALTELGYKVYDFPEHFWYAGDEWMKHMTFGGSLEKLKALYENVDAVCDLPASGFWYELLQLFPDAKVILTEREDEDVWWRSMQNQLSAHNSNLLLRLTYICTYTGFSFCRFQHYLGPIAFGNPTGMLARYGPHKLDEQRAKLVYRRHNAYVKQLAPKDQLLVYNVKDGWDPLCEFLGVAKPKTSFPHRNVRGDLLEKLMREHPMFKRMIREFMISATVLGGLTAYASYALFSSYFF